MLFNSPVYIFIFLPIVLAVHLLLAQGKNNSISKIWLVIASLFFYGYWNPVYLFLLLSSLLVNFLIGHKLQTTFTEKYNTPYRKKLATFGTLFNVGLLAYFKYADFFLQNISAITNHEFPILNIALPLAISFFTFQQIAFLIDCYKEKTHIYSFLDYSLFVTFFPQLIAGPIVHHKQMMPQFLRKSHSAFNLKNISVGITIFSIGLFKKVVIADTFAEWANIGFGQPEALTFYEAWATSLSYTFQLYYDFSGYTDMAIGAALLFNIKLPINFNSPYKALNIQDFWRRWHITLSNWLRDYVYIPLGGNRKGSVFTYQNLFLTFLIGGLWHGAGWTFVIWGALHGLALIIHRLWEKVGFNLPILLSWFLTFMFVNMAWIFFRADNIQDAFKIIMALTNIESAYISVEFDNLLNYLLPISITIFEPLQTETFLSIRILIMIIVFLMISTFSPNSLELTRYIPYKGRLILNPSITTGIILSFVTFLAFLTFVGDSSPAEFLYFNF